MKIVDESGAPVSQAKVDLIPFQRFFYFANGPGFDFAEVSSVGWQKLRQAQDSSKTAGTKQAVFKNISD